MRPISLLNIIPTKSARLKTSGKFPMDMRIISRNLKILLESNPMKSRILVRRLAVIRAGCEKPSAVRGTVAAVCPFARVRCGAGSEGQQRRSGVTSDGFAFAS